MYGPALERSVRKQLDHLDDLCRAFIAASPMLIIGSQGPNAADNSPRGDVPGFVKVADDHTLLIPDRRGNNRLDTLHNLVRNPKVGLLFLVPGVTETFRINGEAVISRDPALTDQFIMQGKAAAHRDCRDGEGSLYSMQPRAGAVRYLESGETCVAGHGAEHGDRDGEAHLRFCGRQDVR